MIQVLFTISLVASLILLCWILRDITAWCVWVLSTRFPALFLKFLGDSIHRPLTFFTTCLDNLCPSFSRPTHTTPSNPWLSEDLRSEWTKLRAAEWVWHKTNLIRCCHYLQKHILPGQKQTDIHCCPLSPPSSISYHPHLQPPWLPITFLTETLFDRSVASFLYLRHTYWLSLPTWLLSSFTLLLRCMFPNSSSPTDPPPAPWTLFHHTFYCLSPPLLSLSLDTSSTLPVFSSCFHSVNHQILLSTLSCLDTWRVGLSSTSPRGHGPLPFTLYTTSLGSIIKLHSYHCYADDTLLVFPASPAVHHNLTVQLCSSMLLPSKYPKNLGIILDDQLSFTKHIMAVS